MMPTRWPCTLLLCCACASTPASAPARPAPDRTAEAPPEALPPLGGFWRSEGYGFQLEFVDDELRLSEVTEISCLPGGRATLASRSPAAVAYRLVGDPVVFGVLPGGSPDRLRIRPDGAASEIVASRLPQRLSVCDRPTPDTPITNFDVFAETWAENYPFFGLTHVDWASVVKRERATITDQTTSVELFGVLQRMIAPLEDAHSYLSARKQLGRHYEGFQNKPGSLDPALFDQAEALAPRYVAGGSLRSFCGGQLEFGMLAANVAYLRINGFDGYTDDGSFEGGLAALESALDAIFTDAERWRALVVDVRINGGGHDPYGVAIAGRLTATDYLAYEKQARSDPRDASRWTASQTTVVHPRLPGFRGPVVELIGPNSLSAAETFTQSLLVRKPTVTRIGQRTQGVFSDVLGRGLPNGWSFGLPNERYVTDGESYDRVGIAPTIAVPIFAKSDMDAGRDTAIEEALRLVRGGAER